jgi:hypothetical protein
MELTNLIKKTKEEIVTAIEVEIHKGGPTNPPLNGLTAVLQMKVIEELCYSIDKFQKSNEKSSKALIVATYVLAGVASIQAIIFALQWLK